MNVSVKQFWCGIAVVFVGILIAGSLVSSSVDSAAKEERDRVLRAERAVQSEAELQQLRKTRAWEMRLGIEDK